MKIAKLRPQVQIGMAGLIGLGVLAILFDMKELAGVVATGVIVVIRELIKPEGSKS